MAKRKARLGKVGKVIGAVAGATPLGRVAKMGIAGARALGGLRGARGRGSGRRRRGLTPEKAFKQIMKLRLKNKILREKMKPLSYIK